MAKKNRTMPPVIFIGPSGQPGRMKLSHTVFRVDERKPDGTPRKLTMILDDETVKIEGGEDFMTGYVPAHMKLPDPEWAKK